MMVMIIIIIIPGYDEIVFNFKRKRSKAITRRILSRARRGVVAATARRPSITSTPPNATQTAAHQGKEGRNK